MKYLVTLLALVVAVGCSSEPKPQSPFGSKKETAKVAKLYMGQPDRMAIAAANEGNCAEMIPLLKCYAFQGRGNEMAQTTLGRCLIKTANKGDTTWSNGLTWLRRAGESGFPEAQSELVRTLSESSEDGDVVEAQTWRIIYERGKSSAFPLPPLPQDLIAKLDARLTPELRTQADENARVWAYRFWAVASDDAEAKAAVARCPRSRPMREPDGRGRRVMRDASLADQRRTGFVPAY